MRFSSLNSLKQYLSNYNYFMINRVQLVTFIKCIIYIIIFYYLFIIYEIQFSSFSELLLLQFCYLDMRSFTSSK